MARGINFETQVIKFYGISHDSKQRFFPGKKSEEFLGAVKFNNKSDYNFFKKCFSYFMKGMYLGESIEKIENVDSYKVFQVNNFVKTVFNRKSLAA